MEEENRRGEKRHKQCRTSSKHQSTTLTLAFDLAVFDALLSSDVALVGSSSFFISFFSGIFFFWLENMEPMSAFFLFAALLDFSVAGLN